MATKRIRIFIVVRFIKASLQITNEHAEELLKAMEKKSYLHELNDSEKRS
jgi:hypothetical protein